MWASKPNTNHCQANMHTNPLQPRVADSTCTNLCQSQPLTEVPLCFQAKMAFEDGSAAYWRMKGIQEGRHAVLTENGPKPYPCCSRVAKFLTWRRHMRLNLQPFTA